MISLDTASTFSFPCPPGTSVSYMLDPFAISHMFYIPPSSCVCMRHSRYFSFGLSFSLLIFYSAVSYLLLNLSIEILILVFPFFSLEFIFDSSSFLFSDVIFNLFFYSLEHNKLFFKSGSDTPIIWRPCEKLLYYVVSLCFQPYYFVSVYALFHD